MVTRKQIFINLDEIEAADYAGCVALVWSVSPRELGPVEASKRIGEPFPHFVAVAHSPHILASQKEQPPQPFRPRRLSTFTTLR